MSGREEIYVFWNQVVDLDAAGITKRVFLWDYQNRQGKGKGSSDTFNLCSQIGKLDCYANLYKVNVNEDRNILHEKEII